MTSLIDMAAEGIQNQKQRMSVVAKHMEHRMQDINRILQNVSDELVVVSNMYTYNVTIIYQANLGMSSYLLVSAMMDTQHGMLSITISAQYHA